MHCCNSMHSTVPKDRYRFSMLWQNNYTTTRHVLKMKYININFPYIKWHFDLSVVIILSFQSKNREKENIYGRVFWSFRLKFQLCRKICDHLNSTLVCKPKKKEKKMIKIGTRAASRNNAIDRILKLWSTKKWNRSFIKDIDSKKFRVYTCDEIN